MRQTLIEKIVKATGVQESETILIHFWGEDADIGVMHDFASAVAMLGASPIELQQSRSVNYNRFSSLEKQPFHESYFEHYNNVDGVIDVFNYQPIILDGALDALQMGFYRTYMAGLFHTLMKAKRFSQIRMPSEGNAKESDLPMEEFRNRMLAAYDIDYDEIRENGQRRVAELSSSSSITMVTKREYHLTFAIDGRVWHVDAGDGDMPCGEVYIAPLEEYTNGEVYFEKLFAQEFGVFQKVVLSVKNGIITESNNQELNEQLAKLETSDKTVCELGFGINPNIESLCGYSVLDEKAFGTFHIAIGNNSMFGGRNESQIHIDFVGTGEALL